MYRVCSVWVGVAWVSQGALHFPWFISTWNKISYRKSYSSHFSLHSKRKGAYWLGSRRSTWTFLDWIISISVMNPNSPHDRYIAASPQEWVFCLYGKVFCCPELPIMVSVWPWNSGMIHYKVCCNGPMRLHNPISILWGITLTFWFPPA